MANIARKEFISSIQKKIGISVGTGPRPTFMPTFSKNRRLGPLQARVTPANLVAGLVNESTTFRNSCFHY